MSDTEYIKLQDLLKINETNETCIKLDETNDNNETFIKLDENNENNENNETYIKLDELIKSIPNKKYQLVYNETDQLFELKDISNGENIRHHCMLQFKMREYNVMCIAYVISEYEINDDYLKIIGMLFIKEGKTLYSIDIVKGCNSSIAQVQLNKYCTDSTACTDSTIIDKIDVFPVKNKMLEYLVSFLSHDGIINIYE